MKEEVFTECIVANPGQRGGDSSHGAGAGYTGGGAGKFNSGYTGGSDGSDGERPDGSSGTHEDISDYIFITWTLTPGDGGSAFYDYSGGNGGVMMNSGGPGKDKYSITLTHPGLVLLEISSG